MPDTKTCPKCGAELPENAPAGICPTCLIQVGIASDQHAGSSRQMKPTTAASGFVPPTPEELGPLFPQLEILELLGKGGMGAVYKARQPRLDRLVALKILPHEISHDPAFAERFEREARALAKFSHPRIVAVYDFGVARPESAKGVMRAEQAGQHIPPQGGTTNGGLCYIVMEFVDGANLRQAIQTGTLKPAEALAIVPQICEALQFAHDEGVVHRDIKPENILIDKRGRVKIADFGLAKLLGQDATDHSLTATHQVMGTLRYMAPEQMQGSREVDHRADIYSLGVVFYELLTGELPMGKFAPPSKKVHIDVRLDEVVLRALEQDPEQRYQHASEIKTDVQTISQSDKVVRPNVKTAGPASDPVLRQVRNPALGLFLAGLLYWITIPFAFGALMQPSVYTNATVQITLLFSLGLVPLIAGTVLVVAGGKMKRLESFGFVVAACLMAIALPGFKLVAYVTTQTVGMALGDFIAAPMALWSLVVLLRSEVKAAFNRPPTAAGGSQTRPQPPAEPRFSRFAIAGAVWAVIGLM
ncbi:MAG: serine/threonine-protein kinase, partial [Planctomycetota bacterium]